MDTARLRLYAELDQKRLRLKKEAESLDAQLAPLEEAILEEIAQEGMAQVKIETPEFGRVTVYLERKIWAKCVDGDWARAVDALRDAGLGDYVETKYNTSSFSAYLRELDKAGSPLPEPLIGAIEPEARLSVRTRRN